MFVQVKRASLVDSRTEVNDVKFAPKHLGLQLVRNMLFSNCNYIMMKSVSRRHVLLMDS